MLKSSSRALTYQPVISLNNSYGAAAIRKYDLYYPSGPTLASTPIVVYIHGGGWTTQDRTADSSLRLQLCRQGFIVYSVEYTLAVAATPATQFPNPMKDIRCFLSYLAEGLAFGDTSKITLFGVSSGAHYGMLAGLAPKSTWADSEHTSTAYTIVSIVSSRGPTGLSNLYPITTGAGQTAVSTLLGYVPASDPAGALVASPVNYVAATTPYLFLQVGGSDTLIPPAQGTDMETAMINAGASAYVSRTVYTGLNHTDPPWFAPGYTPFQDLSGFIAARGR